MNARNGNESLTNEKHLLVCRGTGCTSSLSPKIMEELEKQLEKHQLENIRVIKTGCFGLCAKGPIIVVHPEKTFYTQVKPEDVGEIVEQHLLKGEVVQRLLCKDEQAEKYMIEKLDDLPFYKKQKRIVLKNCGFINPEDIDEYLAMDGYKALEKVLTSMSRQQVIEEIKESGLRGRGGGGFPTGLKWEFAAKQENDQKYIICNADEGDPGAFMDRSVLEGDPHVVLEAMAIGGYAIGANKGFIYVRAEYPIAVKRLEVAIEQAKEYGVLGDNILGTGFKFDVEIRLGAGAFVCGEETALMNSIEGKRGMPNPKPPFPAVSGLFGKPTVINNVETFANIPPIINKGASWFSSIGTEKSKGTKVFALGGKIVNTGLIEVPMGTTLREVIYEIGGGIPNGKNFKAVQTGGPSGGCITAEHLDTPIDYDTLTALGSMMGSGGMIVLDEDNCMVDVARFYLDFTKDESCGKCTPCRIGTTRLLEILEKITEGKGTLEDITKLEVLSEQIKAGSLCGLGQTAPNPVLSTLKYFKEEYIAHVVDKKCSSGVCRSLVEYVIDPDLCKGCTLCARKCPVNAISGKVKEPHVIDTEKCIKCGVCFESCKFKAIFRG
ncbi:NADH dehydrogenase [Vulcanibacillus modesticaldus]|uniref:NADH dehydrogenase n=2 Tax=Vulcanibacillus modesticaldus TaxID=337097 RepID=A0A1D2YX40_9BACI|nr:NADH dehydrogenase [Vulcanibacillus modesticaldus]